MVPPEIKNEGKANNWKKKNQTYSFSRTNLNRIRNHFTKTKQFCLLDWSKRSAHPQAHTDTKGCPNPDTQHLVLGLVDFHEVLRGSLLRFVQPSLDGIWFLWFVNCAPLCCAICSLLRVHLILHGLRCSRALILRQRPEGPGYISTLMSRWMLGINYVPQGSVNF